MCLALASGTLFKYIHAQQRQLQRQLARAITTTTTTFTTTIDTITTSNSTASSINKRGRTYNVSLYLGRHQHRSYSTSTATAAHRTTTTTLSASQMCNFHHDIVEPAAGTAPATPADASEKKHHVGADGEHGYQNPWESAQFASTPRLMYMLLTRSLSGQAHKTDRSSPAVHKPSFYPQRLPPSDDAADSYPLRATWLGHACYYVEFPSGLRVLFDPVFEERCSPVSFAGPKRVTPAPAQVADLPFVDAVFISHNHYDHLSVPTLKQVQERFPFAHFFVPRGVSWAFLFDKCGITQSSQHDWWETRDWTFLPATLGPFDIDRRGEFGVEDTPRGWGRGELTSRITFLPNQHQSGRGPFDRFRALWGSWAIESAGKKIWFAGDTGYRTIPRQPPFTDALPPGNAGIPPEETLKAAEQLPACPAFKQIGDCHGPFDLGLIPIGAYAPTWLFSPMHASPYESVEIFRDTRCRSALAMHWGTWILTEEDLLEPPRQLIHALKRKSLDPDVFKAIDIGQSKSF